MTTDHPAVEIRAAAKHMRATGNSFLAAVAETLDYAAIDADLHGSGYPTVVRGLEVARAYNEEQR